MLDFVAQLRDALADRHLQKLDPPAEVDDAAREAAFAAAVALGRCRASGQELPPDFAGTLDGSLSLAAAEHGRWLVGRLQLRFLDLLSLSGRVDIDSYADQDTRCWIVLARHDLWAATGAIQDADDALADDGKSLPALTNQLTSLIEDTAELDSLLLGHTEELTEAGTLPLLFNLRSGISSATENLPWWLDGTIEATNQRAMESFRRSLPDPLKLDTSIEQVGTVPVMRISGVRVPRPAERITGGVLQAIGRLLLEALPSPALAAASHPLPISSLPQSESLTLADGGTLYCTVFHNSEGKVVVTFRTSAQQLKVRRILVTAFKETGEQVLNGLVALSPDDEGVLSGTLDLSDLDLQHRHTIEFRPEADLE